MRLAVAVVCVVAGAAMGFADEARRTPAWRETEAEIDRIPASENSWPVLLEALSLRSPQPQYAKGDPDAQTATRPGTADWAEAVRWLDANRAYITKVKEMSQRTRVAPPLTDGFNPDLARIIGEEPRATSSSPELGNAQLPHLGYMRAMARGLVLEARAAQEQVDWPRWSEAIVALLGMADQLFRGHVDIENALALSFLQMASDEICAVAGDQALSPSDDVLASLHKRLAAVNAGQRIRVRTDFSERLARDFWDHIYSGPEREAKITKDGTKRLADVSAALIETIESLNGRDGDSRSLESFIKRVGSTIGTRGEIEDKFATILAKCRACGQRRLWELPCDLDFGMELSAEKARYLPVHMFIPDVQKNVLMEAQGEHERAASLLAIACRRFEKARGRWPTTLAELVPVYLDAVPQDEYDGQPVLYRLVDGRPIVYARGVDRDDDDGTPMTTQNAPFPKASWMTVPPDERPNGDFVLWAVGSESRKK